MSTIHLTGARKQIGVSVTTIPVITSLHNDLQVEYFGFTSKWEANSSLDSLDAILYISLVGCRTILVTFYLVSFAYSTSDVLKWWQNIELGASAQPTGDRPLCYVPDSCNLYLFSHAFSSFSTRTSKARSRNHLRKAISCPFQSVAWNWVSEPLIL